MTMEANVQPGDALGRYELLSCVGRGGMAAVWAARHNGAHGFTKIVAIKTMHPELSGDADFQRMFLDEARLAARIRHPNVVETLDLGEHDGQLYIVMEWMDGETLTAIMRAAFVRGGVPLAIALKVIVDASAGAHAAHELCDDANRPLGLVHRDVSPPNVVVSYSGVVKLADFGVAKTLELNNVLTLTGQVKGRLRYMAPEQLLGEPIDRRVDVFALAISLYQLTTGRHPWPGDKAGVTMRRSLFEPPTPPASLVEDYPSDLERIVLKGLARNPAERFQTAAEMAFALEDFARTTGAVATTREVGAYVTYLLGPQGAARREALRSATLQAATRSVPHTAAQLRRVDETWDMASTGDTTSSIPSVGMRARIA
jgi:eukaryotic-like serine/threonine-protein kinase